MFDPQPHLIKLPRKVKDRATGHYTTVYDDYLEVKWRLCWFRDRYPHGVITTDEICVDLDRGYARYRCVVEDGQGGKATGYGTETAADFADYCERAETRTIGRALAALGIGTQFVGQDLTEGEHVADAPVRPPETLVITNPIATTNGDTPPLTVVPTDGGLPCGWDRCARRWPDRYPPRESAAGGSEFSDPKTIENKRENSETFFPASRADAP
jgi:hypothetical protein